MINLICTHDVLAPEGYLTFQERDHMITDHDSSTWSNFSLYEMITGQYIYNILEQLSLRIFFKYLKSLK